MLSADRGTVTIWLVTCALVTWWSRRLVRLRRYRRVGYVHEATVRAVGWDGVPVHRHPPAKVTAGHVAVYAEATRPARQSDEEF